ncbi:MAG: NUDIX hydrolase [Candidatus Delongbacteria bacterium]|jgi:8-oxo-dGTP diphosphatase|nr:NUDIX hydrolase [Candidatus Delongbacteria bacterium]
MSYTYKYPRPMVTVDALVFAGYGEERKVLLIRRKNPPFQGKWALPGGFVDMDEDLDEAVERELKEETGLSLSGFKQLKAFGKPRRDPRGRNISVVFFIQIEKPVDPNAGDDAEQAKWYKVKDLPELAFDHNEVIHEGLEKIE